jgi:hypothetical protein
MKSITKKTFLAVAIALSCGVTSASAQIYVNVRPRHDVVVVRPVAPGPRHVWVDEDWRQDHGRYVYSGGYWAAPPRRGGAWVPGHWRDTPRGSVWIGGHWRY